MRTRSRNQSIVARGDGAIRYVTQGFYDGASPPAIRWQSERLVYDEAALYPSTTTASEIITDVEPSLTQAVNPVSHLRTNRISFPYNGTIKIVGTSPIRPNYRARGVLACGPPVSWYTNVPSFANMVADFYAQSDPRGPIGLRMFQNAMEYAETINLFKGLYKIVKNADKILARSMRHRPAADIKHFNPKGLSASDAKRMIKGPKDPRPSRVTSFADAVTGAWLTDRYGIQPMVGDLFALANMHDQVTAQYVLASKRKHIADRIGVQKSSTSELVTAAPWHLGVSLTFDNQVEQRISGHVTYPNIRLGSQMWDDLTRRYLGLDAILTNLWEVIPLSFVVDWFVDIGGYLARNPTLKLTQDDDVYRVHYTGLCHSWRKVLQPRQTIIGKRSMAFWGVNLDYADYEPNVPVTFDLRHCESSTYYTRVLGLPPAQETPELLTGMSLTHLADGAAILYSRLK